MLGYDLVSGSLVVMHTYLYYFRLSLSHCRLSVCGVVPSAHFDGQIKMSPRSYNTGQQRHINSDKL